MPTKRNNDEERIARIDRLVEENQRTKKKKPIAVRVDEMKALQRSHETPAGIADEATGASTSSDRSTEHRRTALAEASARTTTTAPPTLTCPSCARPLSYAQSHVAGVGERHPEQWDYFTCSTCGAFEYRQRTRTLRPFRHDESEWVKTLKTSR